MRKYLLFVVIHSVVCVAGCCSATRISLCYDPDLIAREDDLQELRIVDVFGGGHPFVDEIVSCLKRDDFPPRKLYFLWNLVSCCLRDEWSSCLCGRNTARR